VLKRFESIHRNSYAALLALVFLFLVYLGVALQAEAPAGGQDSWNHYLFARWCLKHPILMLDLWGKPFFTIVAAPFAQFGIQAVYAMNMGATLLTAWVTYMCGKRLAMRNAWMLILLFGLQPVVLANFHSALTEPTNGLILAIVVYLFCTHRYFWALFVASFLPIIRTEGLVLIAALLPFMMLKGKLKYLPVLLSGSVLFAVLAAVISGEWDYFISHNPYFKFESEGKFDPGSGSFWHYLQAQKSITGFWVTLLIVITIFFILDYLYSRYKNRTPHEMSQLVLWLFLPLIGSYFFAHSFIWYAGMMGSHGLIRVFMVVSPVVALTAHYSLHRIMSLDIRILNQAFKFITCILGFLLAFSGAGFPMPWSGKTTISGYQGSGLWMEALEATQKLGFDSFVLVHQLPELNVHLDLDPFEAPEHIQKGKTQYLWSLDTREGYDWFPSNTVILWDNFHARRDAPMPLDTLRSLGTYVERLHLKHPSDTIYDVRIFVHRNLLVE
jgi:hypothetical protein